MSYRTMPNMKKHISRHNNKCLKVQLEEDMPWLKEVIRCNCKPYKRPTCPMPGACNVSNCVYICTVTQTHNGHKEYYTGATKNFKKRYYTHHASFVNDEHPNPTTLSKHIWNLKDRNIDFSMEWNVKDRAQHFNPNTGLCRLDDKEKYYILMEPQGATLNQRSEFFSHCHHKKPQLLVKPQNDEIQ